MQERGRDRRSEVSHCAPCVMRCRERKSGETLASPGAPGAKALLQQAGLLTNPDVDVMHQSATANITEEWSRRGLG